jgi:hypothetical protein
MHIYSLIHIDADRLHTSVQESIVVNGIQDDTLTLEGIVAYFKLSFHFFRTISVRKMGSG